MGVRNQKLLVSRDETEHLRQNRLSRTLLVHMGVMSWTGGSGKGLMQRIHIAVLSVSS